MIEKFSNRSLGNSVEQNQFWPRPLARRAFAVDSGEHTTSSRLQILNIGAKRVDLANGNLAYGFAQRKVP